MTNLSKGKASFDESPLNRKYSTQPVGDALQSRSVENNIIVKDGSIGGIHGAEVNINGSDSDL